MIGGAVNQGFLGSIPQQVLIELKKVLSTSVVYGVLPDIVNGDKPTCNAGVVRGSFNH